MRERGRRMRRGSLVTLLILAGIYAYLLSYFPPVLLLEPSTATGGDTASHFLTAQALREALLAGEGIQSWMPGNLAGYPAFQLYFPLPFLLIVGLGAVVGLQVSFKLVTVLGIFLLPVACLVAFRQLGFRDPVPALAAAFTLPFLMIEANSVWGGNIPSTLAGEFCFSLGVALAVLFMGTCYRGLVERRRLLANALLLAAIALCHAYALLLAGALSASYLLVLPRLRQAAGYLVRLWALSFALIGFWILPLLAYAPFTSPYSDIWPIDSWDQVVPPVLWPLAVLSLLYGLALLLGMARAPRNARRLEPRVAVPWCLIWVAALLYFVAPHLGAVDIRFLPFLQLGVVLLAAVTAGRVARRARQVWMLPLLLAAAAALWSESRVDYIPRWIDWNYTGFEGKPLWPAFSEVNRQLAGGASDPRVAFEHAPQHNAAGSIRAFESLPLFSGRSTLEGLYIQSSLSTPYIFYLQSEYSQVASCPLPEFHCARLDLERAAEHLRQFNVGELVVRTEPVKAALRRSAEFALLSEVPPYEIHRVRGNEGRYVVPLAFEPVLLESEDWKSDFYRWFMRPGSSRITLVHRASPDEEDLARFPRRSRGLPRVGGYPLPAGVTVEEEILHNEIRIRTSRPGHPLLVRVSYHPRWRLSDGGRVYLASPGFMLIVPREREVRLVFGDTPLTRFGWMMSLAACCIVLVGADPRRRRTAATRRRQRELSRLDRWLEKRRPHLALGLPVAALGLLALFAVQRSERHAPALYERGQEAYRRGNLEAAAELFGRAIEAGPLSSAALHASFYRALSAYRLERWQEAIDLFAEGISEYPDSIYRAESEYHIGLALRRLGRWRQGREVFEALRRRFPETPWAGYAGDRLAEPWPETAVTATWDSRSSHTDDLEEGADSS